MAQEIRTRITLLLPAPTTLPQFFMFNDALDELTAYCGGITTSPTSGPSLDAYDSPLFAGQWIDERTGLPVRDANVFIFGDALVPSTDPALHAYLEVLKKDWQEGFEQDIIWITIHEITRISTDDYVR